MNIFFYSIILLFLSGFISLFIPEKQKAGFFTILMGFGTIGLVYVSLKQLFSAASIKYILPLNYPFGQVRLAIDPLSAFFILVISVMGFLGAVYSMGYMKPYLSRNRPTGAHLFFYSSLSVFMLLVTVCQNAPAFLIVWELMSLSSFFLIVFENEKKEIVDAGINYLIQMHIGFLALLAGFVILWIRSGSPDFASFSVLIQSQRHFAEIIFILLFIGFGMKAGFFPLHTWLPRAHPAAPSPVSGIMSGVMIKIGIYGILRTIMFTGEPTLFISYLVIIVALVSGLLGVIYAIAQHDLKRLLAYHSVENIGIIGIGIGAGMLGMAYRNPAMIMLGFSGAILHVLNHSLFKTLLFFGAGAVYQAAHTRNIEKLGGLVKSMPYTSAFFLVGSLSISGLPPFNGFISELLIYMGMFNGLGLSRFGPVLCSILAVASLAFIGAMAAICFTKVFSVVFLGQPRKKTETREAGPSMLIPMAVISALCLLIGIFPQYVFLLIKSPVLFMTGASVLSQDLIRTLK
ncbi:MAG: proton-conducting transporter membrane subunit, partial [bacterium]|nr:proton-conducting transporter membrane subunit [bacterium]